MKKQIFMSALLAGALLVGCGSTKGSDKSSNNTSSNTPSVDKKSPLTIYPQEPRVASGGGNLKIVPIVRENGKILQNSDSHQLYVTYSSSNPDVAKVTDSGYVEGGNPGEATITVTIEDKNTSKVYKNKITTKVLAVDVNKLFLNPSVASIAQGKSKTFYLTALDQDNSPTLVEDQNIKIKYEKSLLDVSKIITSDKAEVKVKVKEKKGYTFVTPMYKKAGVTVTGDPTLIQFSSIPQINQPTDLQAENDISFMLDKKGAGDNLFIAHTDGDAKLYLDKFNYKDGRWQRKDLEYNGNSIKAPKIVKIDKNLYIIALVNDSKLAIFKSENLGSSWTNDIIDFTNNSSEKDTFDVVTNNGKIYIMLGNNKTVSVGLLETNDGAYSINKLFTYDIGHNIKNVDLAVDHDKNLKFVFTTANNKIYYGKIDQNKTKIANIKSLSGDLIRAKLDFNKYNAPTIIYQIDSKLVKLELTKGGAWSSDSISQLQFEENGLTYDDALTDMGDFDFKVDTFGNVRLVVEDNGNIYYIREFGKTDSKGWRIEQIVSKDADPELAMALDSKNRLKVVYADSNTQWVKYYAEPIYVKYHIYSKKYKVDDKNVFNKNGVIDIDYTTNSGN